MPAEGLCLRVTHTGLARTSLPLNDINDGVGRDTGDDRFRRSGPAYVPENGSVDLVYTSDVAKSFEVGTIRGYINGGHVTAIFVVGATLAPVLGTPVEVLDEGVSLTAGATSLDFAGAGVTATNVGSAVTITIPGGGGGGDHATLANLGWLVSAHTGAVNALAGFDGAGATTTYSRAVTGDVSGTFPGPLTVTDFTIGGETIGDVLYFDGANWTRLVAGTIGDVLTTQGAAAPSWVTPSPGTTDHAALATNLLWSTSGHTGTVSTLAAFDGAGAAVNLSTTVSGDVAGTFPGPLTVTDFTLTGEAQGNIPYFDGVNWVVLAVGVAGQLLQTNGAGVDPSWVNAPTDTDELVGVSANDTTPGYLLAKLTTTTTGVAWTEINDGGDEDLRLDVDSATTGGPGLIEIALQAEVDTGTDTTRAVTPATLASATTVILDGQTAGGDLGGTYPNPTVDDGADGTAIHDNVAGEILAITVKAVPVGADILLIEDSAAGNIKKRITVGTLPTGGGGEANTASNVNTAGVGVFKQKTGIDLEFRGVNAASAKATVVLDAGTNEIRVDVADASTTQAGAIEIATQGEVDTGSATTLAIVPDTLANSALAGDVATNTAKVTNATHTGEVTGATALTITANAVTNAKLADVATSTFKGRITAGVGDPEDLNGTQATTLLDPFTSVLQGVVPASGGVATDFLSADGTWGVPAGGITGPGSSVDRGRVVWDGTGGVAIDDTGLRDYGASATDPVAPVPADGDTYRNTVLDMQMYYDGTRAKWLSTNTAELWFGRNGNTGAGSYYRGPGNKQYENAVGRNAEYDGTVVSITYTRSDTTAATFEITADGTGIATLLSSAVKGQDLTINADFSQGEVLGGRNETGGSTTSNVHAWAMMRWRV